MNRALVCIPTYNEADNLGPITQAVLKAEPRVDILVVDDNSPDGTGKLADQLAAQEPRIRVLHREKKEGLGRAYLAAFRWALAEGYTYIIEMDADFSHPPRFLPGILAGMSKNDVMIGSRYVPGGGTEKNPEPIPAYGTHGRAHVVGTAGPSTFGTNAVTRPMLSGSRLLATVPSYLP